MDGPLRTVGRWFRVRPNIFLCRRGLSSVYSRDGIGARDSRHKAAAVRVAGFAS